MFKSNARECGLAGACALCHQYEKVDAETTGVHGSPKKMLSTDDQWPQTKTMKSTIFEVLVEKKRLIMEKEVNSKQ